MWTVDNVLYITHNHERTFVVFLVYIYLHISSLWDFVWQKKVALDKLLHIFWGHKKWTCLYWQVLFLFYDNNASTLCWDIIMNVWLILSTNQYLNLDFSIAYLLPRLALWKCLKSRVLLYSSLTWIGRLLRACRKFSEIQIWELEVWFIFIR